jgi:hypothetical protein
MPGFIEFDNRIKFWILDNPKVTDDLKQVVSNQQASLAIHLDDKKSYQLAAITDLTTAIGKNELSQKALSRLLPFYSMAFADMYPCQVDEKEICNAVLAFLQKALSSAYMKITDEKEKAQLGTLVEKISSYRNQNSVSHLVDLHHVIVKVINLAQYNLQQPSSQQYLNHLKAYINAIAASGLPPVGNYQRRVSSKEEDFKLMAWQIKQFLQKTVSRLDTPENRKRYSFARQKITYINNFIQNQCSDENINEYLTTYADFSLTDLLENFTCYQHPDLEFVLAQNKASGIQGKSTSLTEFHLLKKRFEKVFDLKKEEDLGKQQYLSRVETIKTNLQYRKDNAGIFKDIKLYDKKIEKLNSYIEQIKQLIEYKRKNEIADIDSEIRLIKNRVENDPDVYRSTAKFFGLKNNVTVVKDIQRATHEFLNNRS